MAAKLPSKIYFRKQENVYNQKHLQITNQQTNKTAVKMFACLVSYPTNGCQQLPNYFDNWVFLGNHYK